MLGIIEMVEREGELYRHRRPAPLPRTHGDYTVSQVQHCKADSHSMPLFIPYP